MTGEPQKPDVGGEDFDASAAQEKAHEFIVGAKENPDGSMDYSQAMYAMGETREKMAEQFEQRAQDEEAQRAQKLENYDTKIKQYEGDPTSVLYELGKSQFLASERASRGDKQAGNELKEINLKLILLDKAPYLSKGENVEGNQKVINGLDKLQGLLKESILENDDQFFGSSGDFRNYTIEEVWDAQNELRERMLAESAKLGARESGADSNDQQHEESSSSGDMKDEFAKVREVQTPTGGGTTETSSPQTRTFEESKHLIDSLKVTGRRTKPAESAGTSSNEIDENPYSKVEKAEDRKPFDATDEALSLRYHKDRLEKKRQEDLKRDDEQGRRFAEKEAQEIGEIDFLLNELAKYPNGMPIGEIKSKMQEEHLTLNDSLDPSMTNEEWDRIDKRSMLLAKTSKRLGTKKFKDEMPKNIQEWFLTEQGRGK